MPRPRGSDGRFRALRWQPRHLGRPSTVSPLACRPRGGRVRAPPQDGGDLPALRGQGRELAVVVPPEQVAAAGGEVDVRHDGAAGHPAPGRPGGTVVGCEATEEKPAPLLRHVVGRGLGSLAHLRLGLAAPFLGVRPEVPHDGLTHAGQQGGVAGDLQQPALGVHPGDPRLAHVDDLDLGMRGEPRRERGGVAGAEHAQPSLPRVLQQHGDPGQEGVGVDGHLGLVEQEPPLVRPGPVADEFVAQHGQARRDVPGRVVGIARRDLAQRPGQRLRPDLPEVLAVRCPLRGEDRPDLAHDVLAERSLAEPCRLEPGIEEPRALPGPTQRAHVEDPREGLRHAGIAPEGALVGGDLAEVAAGLRRVDPPRPRPAPDAAGPLAHEADGGAHHSQRGRLAGPVGPAEQHEGLGDLDIQGFARRRVSAEVRPRDQPHRRAPLLPDRRDVFSRPSWRPCAPSIPR